MRLLEQHFMMMIMSRVILITLLISIMHTGQSNVLCGNLKHLTSKLTPG